MASTSSNRSTYSTPSVLPSTEWDVFLSFRGIDTRYSFTDHLYNALHRNGIRTYRDDPELRTGEVISDALLKAIHLSKSYIIVLSENYASSRWCLDELVEILDFHKTMQRLVIPVFYNINPSVVGHQTESFKQAFEKHETCFDKDRLDKWRVALTAMGKFSGKVSKNTYEAGIIDEIVNEVLVEINPKTLYVAKYPVGLAPRVQKLIALLRSGTEGVTRIGIYGMGGVGKTTLAKALYNKLLQQSFKGSSFVANVREISRTKGLESLQQQLIDDVLKSKEKVKVYNVEEGIMFIRERICSAKILLVIDDVDDFDQYESLVGPFASGSVVIITTRDEDILEKVEVEPTYRYMVQELDDALSLTLFTRHAFGKATPDNTLMVLSTDILRFAGGLPLALKVFGSYLYKRSEVGWKAYIEQLQRNPNTTIKEKLKISLDALELDDPLLKKIFLDIACIFIGKKRKKVVQRVETYYYYAAHYIDILKKKCLVTIDDSDKLGMHDLLRDMGREIARNNCPDEPGKHSRLWMSKDISDVLKNHKGTEAIEVIFYHNVKKVDAFAMETFKRMSKLRFLHLYGVNLSGSFEQTFEDLRWLYWKYCPLRCFPSEFHPQTLVVLELPRSRMIQMWKLDMASQVFKNMKTLNMSYSLDLARTPDFTKLPSLESLNLEGCGSLTELHISIGSLAKLVSLDLTSCEGLIRLPDTICELRALTVLCIDYCISLKALPVKLGNIKSLKVLNAKGIAVSKLPDSIGRLINLVELRLCDNKNLKTLPGTISNLRLLEILDIDDCSSLEALPAELGNIKSLKELCLQRIAVSELPDSIGHLSKLVKLMLTEDKNLKTLPDTICNLRSLDFINISGCKGLETLPTQLWKITRLTDLVASSVTMLQRLPDIELSEIASSMKKLDLSNNDFTALPSGISQLSNLEDLNVGSCGYLLSIAELPSSLKRLNAHLCKSLKRLPNLSNLKQLKILSLTDCSALKVIQGLEGLNSIQSFRLGTHSNLFLTEQLFQIYSRFGHDITMYIPSGQFPYWISHSRDWIPSDSELTMSLDLLPNVSYHFLAMIICFKRDDFRTATYSVKSSAGDFIWGGTLFSTYREAQIILLPISVLSVKRDDRIVVTADTEIVGIRLLY